LAPADRNREHLVTDFAPSGTSHYSVARLLWSIFNGAVLTYSEKAVAGSGVVLAPLRMEIATDLPHNAGLRNCMRAGYCNQ
jgi:hypothetical protein